MNRSLYSAWLVALTLLCASGCYSPWMRSEPEAALVASGQYDIITELDIPEVKGLEGCGAQALAAVLAFSDSSLDAGRLAADLPWHDEGGDPVALLLEARRRGFDATIHRGDWDMLAQAITRTQPGLVMVDSGLEVRTLSGSLDMPAVMHWAVVSGMAADRSRLLIGAPSDRHHIIPREQFLHRWSKSDFCLILVGPSGNEQPAGD